MGTLTVGLDVGQGLYADDLYKAEIDRLRAEGRKVAEFTKLAVDTKQASKQVLASLFHIAYIHLRRLWRYTDMVIEVNPAHADFYKRMLGFEDFGPQRHCARVNAPAVLLRLEADRGDGWIEPTAAGPSSPSRSRPSTPTSSRPGKTARSRTSCLRASVYRLSHRGRATPGDVLPRPQIAQGLQCAAPPADKGPGGHRQHGAPALDVLGWKATKAL